MKKLPFVLSCCAFTLSATAASAAGVYVGGNIGFAVVPDLTATRDIGWERLDTDISFDTGLALNGAIGYDFDNFRAEGVSYDNFRGEAEIGYQRNNSSDDTNWSVNDFRTADLFNGHLSAVTYMANGYYDFKNNTPWTPFLGAGIGAATIKIDDITVRNTDINYSVDDTVFAYQFMAGVSYVINKNLAVDLSYRFVGADNPTFDDHFGRPIDFEFYSHNFLLGARYTF